jgi:hypothetical protein
MGTKARLALGAIGIFGVLLIAELTALRAHKTGLVWDDFATFMCIGVVISFLLGVIFVFTEKP